MSHRLSRALLGLGIVAALALALAPAASAAPGDLDPSFGSGGQLRLLESNEESFAGAVAVQTDGRILVAGYEKGNAVVLRLLANGSLDPGFGVGGKTTTVLPGGFSEFQALAIQPDGKIVAVGAAKGAVNTDFLFARFNTDGLPDPGFGGGDGIEIVPVGAEADQAQAVALGPGGRIVATGSAEKPVSNRTLAAVVLQENGTPDSGFAGDGSVTKETTAGFDSGRAVAALGDGSLVIGDANGAGGGDGFTVMKLLSNGEYDPGFGGGDGIVVTPIPIDGAMIEAGRISDLIAIPDGRIVAVGSGYDYYGSPASYHPKLAAVRYLANGALDPSFGSGGIFTHRVSDSTIVATVDQAEAGRYLLGGWYDNTGLQQIASLVVRLTPGGSLDPAFGTGGVVARPDTAPFGESISGAAVDSEDRLVTVGTGYGGNNTSWASLARYLGDRVPAQPISVRTRKNQAAHARMKKVPRKVTAEKLKGFSGTAKDFDGHGLKRVQIALVKKAKAKGKKKKPVLRWKKVKGKAKWSFKLKRDLPPGRYVVYARAIDGQGLAETKFSRKLRNRYAFRVLPSR